MHSISLYLRTISFARSMTSSVWGHEGASAGGHARAVTPCGSAYVNIGGHYKFIQGTQAGVHNNVLTSSYYRGQKLPHIGAVQSLVYSSHEIRLPALSSLPHSVCSDFDDAQTAARCLSIHTIALQIHSLWPWPCSQQSMKVPLGRENAYPTKVQNLCSSSNG